jgi:hypothetical protein
MSTAERLFEVSVMDAGPGVAATADEVEWLIELVTASEFGRQLNLLVEEAEMVLDQSVSENALVLGPIEIIGEQEVSMVGSVLYQARQDGLELSEAMNALKRLLDDIAIETA